MSAAKWKGSYGVDAPELLPVLGVLFLANIVEGVVSRALWPFLGAFVILVCAGMGLYASRWGKFAVWAELLDELKLQGDERMLDIGSGRGAVLLMAAQQLTTGRAVGVDLWKKRRSVGQRDRGDSAQFRCGRS